MQQNIKITVKTDLQSFLFIIATFIDLNSKTFPWIVSIHICYFYARVQKFTHIVKDNICFQKYLSVPYSNQAASYLVFLMLKYSIV